MKEIELLGKRFLVKDYYCASEDRNYIMNPDPKFWLYINLTNYCPAYCPFCVARKTITESNHISLKKLEIMLSRISAHLSGISITGGEPLTEIGCLRAAVHVIRDVVGNQIELDLATNGYNIMTLDKELLKQFTTIHISRHAVLDEEQNRIMEWKAPSLEDLSNWLGRQLVFKADNIL